MSDYNHDDDDFDPEQDAILSINISRLRQEAPFLIGSVLGTVLTSEFFIRPFLSEVTGRKLKRLPIFAGTYLLSNFFFHAPSLYVRQQRRAEELISEKIPDGAVKHDLETAWNQFVQDLEDLRKGNNDDDE